MKVLNKNFLRRSLAVLGGLFLLCSFIVYLPSALCSEPPIIAGKTQMSLSGQQVLSIMNYQTGKTYSWSIQSGGGSLSASSGKRVIYTAP